MTLPDDWTLSGLRLTVAHHGDNEFYELGRITNEATPQQMWDLLAADPATECCKAEDTGHDLCYLVDQVLEKEGDMDSIGDSREVTADKAAQMLGVTPAVLADALEAARAGLAAFYLSQETR